MLETRRSSRGFVLVAITLALAGCASAPPMDPATVRVNVFRGASNIPIYLAQDGGNFARRALKVELQFTPNSQEQRAGLPAGRFEIAHAAIDNTVAMVEVAKHDAVIVAGGDSGMNELIVRNEIGRLADVRGKNLLVDAPNTAYALVARKILKNAGLVDGRDYKLLPIGGTEGRSAAFATSPDNAAGMLNPPWNFIVQERGGVKSLGRVKELLGPYQATGVFVMRPWASANAGVLERYLAAYIEGCRAALDPANRAAVLAALTSRLGLNAKNAELTYQALVEPGFGLARDCAFDVAGFRAVLALRAEIGGQWGGVPPAPEKYLDPSYYQRALRQAAAR